MSSNPRIPMLPTELPQQRLYLVRGLPEAPAGWKILRDAEARKVATRAMPRSARYVGQVEWAWSPANSRLDAYYVSMDRSRRHWVLWLKFFDDNWMRWDEGVAVAAAPRCRLPEDDAAALLLQDFWLRECDGGVDRFHWVNEDGIVDTGGLVEIASTVWGDEDD